MRADRYLASLPDDPVYDLAVLGAGAAGLACAATAARLGLRVLVVERTAHVGGTSAYSAGTLWVPNTRHAQALNADDDSTSKRRSTRVAFLLAC